MKRLFLIVGAVLAAVAGGLAFSLVSSGESDGPTTVRIHFSHFSPAVVTATAGEPITLVLQNDDPIEHEWIVGTEDVHERHRTGTEPYHDQIPTEVTIPALQSRTSTVKFAQPGEYAFVCHLPGHEAYGMRGVLRVMPPD
jgi:uncharacterized cupredoxin-like copper-binding protein